MTYEELEEALDELLPTGYSIEEDDHGQLIIFTNLSEDEDGDLQTFSEEEGDFDPDLESLENEDDDE